MTALFDRYIRFLVDEIWPVMPWSALQSLHLFGSLGHGVEKRFRSASDVDLLAVARNKHSLKEVMSAFKVVDPGDCGLLGELQTIVPDQPIRVSLHVYTEDAIKSIVSLQEKRILTWRSPAEGITAKFIYRALDGDIQEEPVHHEERDGGFLCSYPILIERNGRVYYGMHVQHFLSFTIPILDDGFFTGSLQQLHGNLSGALAETSPFISIFRERHDQAPLCYLQLRNQIPIKEKES